MTKKFLSYSLIVNGVTEENFTDKLRAEINTMIKTEKSIGLPEFGFIQGGFTDGGEYLVEGKIYARTKKECNAILSSFKREAKIAFSPICKSFSVNYLMSGETF